MASPMNLAKNNLVIVALAAVALYLLLSPRSAFYGNARKRGVRGSGGDRRRR